MAVSEFVVCRKKPVIVEQDGYHLLLFERDTGLSIMYADRMKMICGLISSHIEEFEEENETNKWTLPQDPESRLIKYKGEFTKYSKLRFGILKALILARGRPVSYEDISQAGWGGNSNNRVLVDPDVIKDAVYGLNKFMDRNGITEFIRCDKEHVKFDPHFTGSVQVNHSSHKRTNVHLNR